ncbi:MAG: hypothetical protein H0T77_07370 [Pyrinomonadaceae bacterium]|nr:hypothetical protein [Pyrinomonadaceae bacterium]
MHGAKNYPLFKAESSLDIELPDGTDDESYLQTLAHYLPFVIQHDPDILFYLGGADPYAGDKLGRLELSIDGLRRRDEYVLDKCYQCEIPTVTVMPGGYGENISDTVEIHCQHHSSREKHFRVGRRFYFRESRRQHADEESPG